MGLHLRRAANVFRRDASPRLWVSIDTGDSLEIPLEPYRSYFRVWLSELFLKRDRDWFANCYPAVHASVRLCFDQQEQATFTTLSRPPLDALGPGVAGNFALTPLLPYRGGTVELEAGLTALRGSNALVAGFDILRDFSTLVGPPLAEALGVAEKVTGGMQKLRQAVEHEVKLGLHQGFAAVGGGGDNVFRSGYWALIDATEDEIAPSHLRVEGDRLRVLDGNTTRPLTGYEYLLLRIEGRVERDDWRFPIFENLIRKAKLAHFANEQASYLVYRNAVFAEVLSSPDLTETDRQRAVRAIKDEFEATISAGLGMTEDAWPDLAAIIMHRAPSVDEVKDVEPLTLERMLHE